MKTFSILIPIYKGENYIAPLFDSIGLQDARPEEIVVVDSSPRPGTLEKVRAYGDKFNLVIRSIPSSEFNHGGTRNLASREARGDILVFMSQDIVLQGRDCLSRLLDGFRDPAIASVFGRQIPYPYHSPVNRFLRHYNYGEREILRDGSTAARFGIKAYFNSNSFSGYRRDVFESVGGFNPDIIFGEDTVLTKSLMEKGYKVLYTPAAVVMHSHDYSLEETFRRYFDLGVCHSAIFGGGGGTGGGARNRSGGAGAGYLAAQVRWLLANGHVSSIPAALADLLVKGAGYKLGFHSRHLPLGMKRRISMNKAYWTSRYAAASSGGAA